MIFGITKEVNKAMLKIDLLKCFPDAQEQCEGKNTVITLKDGM